MVELLAKFEDVRSPLKTAHKFGVEEIIDPRDTRPMACDVRIFFFALYLMLFEEPIDCNLCYSGRYMRMSMYYRSWLHSGRRDMDGMRNLRAGKDTSCSYGECMAYYILEK